jgi:hypothetical protein
MIATGVIGAAFCVFSLACSSLPTPPSIPAPPSLPNAASLTSGIPAQDAGAMLANPKQGSSK